MDLPRINEPSAKMMRSLVDTSDQKLSALERFGYDTKEWCPVIAVMLFRKLDQVTLSVWEMDREPPEPPASMLIADGIIWFGSEPTSLMA